MDLLALLKESHMVPLEILMQPQMQLEIHIQELMELPETHQDHIVELH